MAQTFAPSQPVTPDPTESDPTRVLDAPVTAVTAPITTKRQVLPRDGLVSDTREVAAIVAAGADVAGELDPALKPFVEACEAALGVLGTALDDATAAVADLRRHASGAVASPPTA